MDRALLASYAFPPLAFPESYLSAKTMGRLGVSVDVLSAVPSRDWGLDPSLDLYCRARFGEVRRVELPWFARTLPARALPWSRRPDLLVHANRRLVQAARPDLGKYQVLVTWSQFHSVHLAGLSLKRARPALGWVAHFSDPWVDNPYETYDPAQRRANARLEADVVEAADALVFTSRATRDLMLRKYPTSSAAKAHVVPHPFDPSLYPEAKPQTGPLVVRYLGGFYGPRTPAPLFEGLRRLLAESPNLLRDVRVEVVGDMPHGSLEHPAFRALSGLLEVRGRVQYLASLRLMAEADLLIVVDAPAAHSPFLPSKLVDYLGAGRPILGITPPGVSRDVLRELGAPVADPTDSDAVAQALAEGIALAAKYRGTRWGRETVRERYHVRTVAAATNAVLESVAGGAGA